jgi:integral membrane sensor domain MASE1
MGSAGASRASKVVVQAEDAWLPALVIFPTFLAAFATLLFACERGPIAGFWPADAVMVALILQTRPKDRWKALVAGAGGLVWARLMAGCPLTTVLAFSAINGLEVLVCSSLVSLSTRNAFDPKRLTHWLSFLAAAGVAAPASAALLAGGFLAAVRGASFLASVRSWYAGDALGLVVATPILVMITQGLLQRWRRLGCA